MTLKNLHIVITGGSSGIGKALALECVSLGARVAIIANHREKIDETVAETEPKALGFVCDISDKAAVIKTFEQIIESFGTIDVLVNNAGYATYHTFHESSLDDLDRLTRVNYLGALYCSKLALDQMVRQKKSGQIINVASVAGVIPITPCAAYGAAKHALVSLTETLRCEYAHFGIHFSLMLPGRVDTAFFNHESFKKRKQRPEHSGMLSAQSVAHSIVKQIENQTQTVTRPRFFALVRWLYGAFPFFIKPVFNFILKKRIKEHYARQSL